MPKPRKSKTYPATAGGKRVRVTIPENPDPTEVMVEAIKDNISPQAVAAIIVYLHPDSYHTSGRDCTPKRVAREVKWFREELVKAVGGNTAFNQLMDEVGL